MTGQEAGLVNWLTARTPSAPVTTAETHVSILAFQGDRVYKLKKAVRFDFVDLSTAARRRANCEREVELNRRLAPDVYLGVETVADPAGRSVDSVVVMRRMPDDRRLSTLATHHGDVGECIDRVAQLIARFHATAATDPAVASCATGDAVAALWDRELTEFPGSSSDVARLAQRYVAGRGPLFDARIEDGRARDGHGDLLADDVFCLPDGPRVLDCLEFDDRLRFGDVLADVAFLAMDLERLGRTDLAQQFLRVYRDASGDSWPVSLEHFYIAYRAHVRAKVAALSHDEEGSQARQALALDHLERAQIRLVLIGGAPGTGKTTVARAIGSATKWPVLRSDEVRKELAGIDPAHSAAAALDQGLYDETWTSRTYAELLDRARVLLEHGTSVVLDASWSDPSQREAARTVAARTVSDLVPLRCETPIDVAMARAERRARQHSDASDAGGAVAAARAARFAHWPDARSLDTTAPPAAVAEVALMAVGRA